MNGFNKLLIAMSVCGVSSLAQASDSTFVGLAYGKTGINIEKSSQLKSNLHNAQASSVNDGGGTWGLRIGQQNEVARYYATYEQTSGRRDGLKLSQQNLLGSYDAFLPVTPSTQLFGGVTMGVTKFTQRSPGYSRDSDTGYAIGAQVGVLQHVSTNMSMELGYRYLRSNASPEVVEYGTKLGSIQLNGSAQGYLAVNYAF
ncbi:hypothetical protein EXN22_21070 [Pseudomonas tructae]|uniref:Uncharacterized protein n=1 Tax=Pseudomonas tructae TaxID=2518644 RepID=A0A411MMJ4_9PSED|nr:outer membrane beta-barrel protein [Pseudomonas tructae]QBF28056.1 hypothetical protein EXN22_21070 [Pseudomonas tructae]